MDQRKIGMFLKQLRREKQVTQEQLAEMLGVSNRSVSRWENGVNMPDFDLVIELADYYDVGIEEILDGERKIKMDNNQKEKATLLKVSDYENSEKKRFSGRIFWLFIAAILAFSVYIALDVMGLASAEGYEQIASFALGLVFGTLLVGALYTSRYMTKIQAFKRRLLAKIRNFGRE